MASSIDLHNNVIAHSFLHAITTIDNNARSVFDLKADNLCHFDRSIQHKDLRFSCFVSETRDDRLGSTTG